jgi:hypothetical protein
MRPFKDAEGREWKLSMTVPGIERVLQATGLNIVNPLAPKVGAPQHEQPDILTLLLNDVVTFSKVLQALLNRQLEKEAVKPEDFAEALDTEALGSAWRAFREEWNDFFQSRSQPEMVTLLDQQAAAQTKMTGIVTELSPKAMEAMETKANEALTKATKLDTPFEPVPETPKPSVKPSMASASVTSGPVSAASTPAA